ncbi:MAG: InlB B-repeat-containing protein [Clostridia bacterium]|nr:InlB B-repeat-containing protein [Clostridia bacterium]
MKKIYKVIVALVLALSLVCVFALAACGNKDDETKDNPSGSGSSYTVTIVINDSDTKTQMVEAGGTATEPEEPTSDSGSIFAGWYADSQYTEIFDWNSEITENTTVYAEWITVGEGQSVVTFYANYDGGGKLAVVAVDTGDKMFNTPSASRTGYKFMGWNTAADGTGDTFQYGSYVRENMSVYAIWYKGYVMEAEYTDLTDQYGEDLVFYQYSNNLSGTGAIIADDTCSNGKFLCSGSQASKYMLFEVTSAVAIDNATLTMTASMNYGYGISDNNTYPDDGDSIGTVCVTSSMCKITVFSASNVTDENAAKTYTGGTSMSYDTMSFNMSTVTDLLGHCAFSTFTIGNISLAKGTNYIRILVTSDANRTSAGGQTTAKSVNVDCLTIYSSEESNLTQKTYQT